MTLHEVVRLFDQYPLLVGLVVPRDAWNALHLSCQQDARYGPATDPNLLPRNLRICGRDIYDEESLAQRLTP